MENGGMLLQIIRNGMSEPISIRMKSGAFYPRAKVIAPNDLTEPRTITIKTGNIESVSIERN